MDIRMTRGDTEPVTVTVTNVDGTPVDLTGATLTFTCKVSPYDNAPVFTRTAQDVATPAAGVATITIQSSDTSSLTDYAVYVYDVQLQEADGAVSTVQSGNLIIDLDVTL